MVYQLHQEQFLPISLEEAWDFFSSPHNLAKITPKEMGFVILGEKPKKMYAGQIIQYIVSPVAGIPMRWVTEITHVNAPYFFVDEQRYGPYTMWHHQHVFEEVEGGVLMKDIVSYQLPLGILGRLAHAIFVKKKLQGIFTYRKKYLDQKFNNA